MLFDSPSEAIRVPINQSLDVLEPLCSQRASQGYMNGMGIVFRKLATTGSSVFGGQLTRTASRTVNSALGTSALYEKTRLVTPNGTTLPILKISAVAGLAIGVILVLAPLAICCTQRGCSVS